MVMNLFYRKLVKLNIDFCLTTKIQTIISIDLLSKSCSRRERYLKNSLSKSIAHVIKHANFQLYRAYNAGVIWKSTIDDKYIYKRVRLHTHQNDLLLQNNV